MNTNTDLAFDRSGELTDEEKEAAATWAAENIELRGYELATRAGDTWKQVMHYRPTNLGLAQAKADATNLNLRWPKQYTVRPIISISPPKSVEVPPVDETPVSSEDLMAAGVTL